MSLPFGANFKYEEDGILFRVNHKNNRIKIYARKGNRTIIEFGDTPHEAAEKAKKRLRKAPLEWEGL